MLTSLHALITRPEPQASELADLIREKGGTASVYPAFSIADPLDKDALQSDIEALDNTDVAIFVSPNAVKKTMPLWQAYWKKLPENLSVVAVGKSTQKMLKTYGLENILGPEDEFNSEALLALPELQSVQNKKVIIFQGETGRGLLEKVLAERGASVTIAVAYRRIISSPVSESILLSWQQKGVNCVIYTSAEGLLNFFELVDPEYHSWLKGLTSLVISPRLVKIAAGIGIKNIIQSKSSYSPVIVEKLEIFG